MEERLRFLARLLDGSFQRDFLVVWQETKEGKRVTRKVFIGKHGDPWDGRNGAGGSEASLGA